ncbi:tripartite tricarboxylate transporter substrate binding protein [Piscinibacter sp. XHJ-5]|uniref:tripartite tricarboxylate transporter substrate binding protein n=1 Tax=Piscinibacter sp. XHJ-5 TaxID=3037797 RepID=UPI00245328B4|nr:tripartite tricarboxylate transporter substrate binding protein [Piscinibacter sp. XHJ-5]
MSFRDEIPCTGIERRDALIRLFAAAAAAAGVTAARPARADAFPSKPITLILPFPPGGSFDPILRALCNAAAQDLGQPIVLMHKPGGGGVTGTASLTTMSESDGYTIAVMHNSVIRQPLLMKTAWHPLKDFSYLIGLAGLATAVSVAADAKWQTLSELLADAKARPGAISWGNVGAISVNRIYAERLAKAAGAQFNLIPFKGGSEAFQALLGHHLDVYGDPGFGPMATSGKVRLLATFTEQRLKRWPQVPTVKELGHDLVIESAIGLVAPKNLDPAIGARLHAAFKKAMDDPEYRRMVDEFDLTPHYRTGPAYRAYAEAQFAREKTMLDESGFKPE